MKTRTTARWAFLLGTLVLAACLAGTANASELADPAMPAGPVRALPRVAPLDGAAPRPLAAAGSSSAPLVTIDPGHGGPYNNASYGSLKEKAVNLALARVLRDTLFARGYRVSLTRWSDRAVSLADIPTWHWLSWAGRWSWSADGTTRYSGVPYDDLQARCDAARSAGASLFISVHNNGVSSSAANGTETFAAHDDARGQRAAALIQSEVVKATGLRDRGAKTTDYYVIRWADMPGVLVEGGFITNAHDRALLTSVSGRAALARGIAKGIDRFFAERPLAPYWLRLDRADTESLSAALSGQTNPSGGSPAFITRDGAYSDVIAVTPVAHMLRASVLAVGASRLSSSTAQELTRLRPSRVVLVGAAAALATPVVDAIASASGSRVEDIETLAGADRYATAAAIARQRGLSAARICVVGGRGSTDAAVAAPYCAANGIPILFSDATGMPAATRAFIAERRARIGSVLVVGGTGAVPVSGLEGLPGVTRIAGTDAAQTAIRVLEATRASPVGLTVADGARPGDVAWAAVAATRLGRSLMFTGDRSISSLWREWLENHWGVIGSIRTIGTAGNPPSRFDQAIRKAID